MKPNWADWPKINGVEDVTWIEGCFYLKTIKNIDNDFSTFGSK